MELFISWSGNKSKKIAEVFREWIPNLLQNVKPYFSPADTEKGSKWASEVSKKLSNCKCGIICLTSENVQNNWIMFEAGALSKLSSSRVSPILFNVEYSQISGPLALFQGVKFDKTEISQLFFNINNFLKPPVPDKTFFYTFEKIWPDLQNSITSILNEKNDSIKK